MSSFPPKAQTFFFAPKLFAPIVARPSLSPAFSLKSGIDRGSVPFFCVRILFTRKLSCPHLPGDSCHPRQSHKPPLRRVLLSPLHLLYSALSEVVSLSNITTRFLLYHPHSTWTVPPPPLCLTAPSRASQSFGSSIPDLCFFFELSRCRPATHATACGGGAVASLSRPKIFHSSGFFLSTAFRCSDRGSNHLVPCLTDSAVYRLFFSLLGITLFQRRFACPHVGVFV